MGKMQDMGSLPKHELEMSVPEGENSKEKPKKHYPSFSVDPSVMKELRGKSLGDMCRLEIVVEVTGMEENEYRSAIDLKIKKAKYMGEGSEDEDTTVSDKRSKIKAMYQVDDEE